MSLSLQLLLMMLLLIVFNSFFVLVHSTEFCRSSASKTEKLRFTDVPGPATLSIGCINLRVNLICCTAGPRGFNIEWFQTKDRRKTWIDFKNESSVTRGFSEGNQVAYIDKLDEASDFGSYKCVANDDEENRIENVVYLEIRNCSNYNKIPDILDPSNETEVKTELHLPLFIPCLSFVGFACETDSFCDSGWLRKPNTTDPDDFTLVEESTYDNSSSRVYSTTRCIPETYSMLSILTIKKVTDEDFIGSYDCWADNTIGFAYPDGKVFLLKKSPLPPKTIFALLAGYIGGAVALLFVVLILVTKLTRVDLNAQIWWAKKKFNDADGGSGLTVIFDIESNIESSFSRYLQMKLNNKTGVNFEVFSSDNVPGNEAVNNRLLSEIQDSRHTLVVLSTEFVANPRWTHIVRDALTHVNPIFIHFDYVSFVARNQPLDDSIRAALRINPPLIWPGRTSPADEGNDPLLEDGFWESGSPSSVNIFWKKLILSCLKRKRSLVVQQL